MCVPASFEVTEIKGKVFTRVKDAPNDQQQFISFGADGNILFWDMRKAHEQPEEKKDHTGKAKKEGWGPMAKMNLVPIRRGYWGKNSALPHTVPMKLSGSCGSVSVRLIPAPRGTGLVAAPAVSRVVIFVVGGGGGGGGCCMCP